jgi:hypothetical protein
MSGSDASSRWRSGPRRSWPRSGVSISVCSRYAQGMAGESAVCAPRVKACIHLLSGSRLPASAIPLAALSSGNSVCACASLRILPDCPPTRALIKSYFVCDLKRRWDPTGTIHSLLEAMIMTIEAVPYPAMLFQGLSSCKVVRPPQSTIAAPSASYT